MSNKLRLKALLQTMGLLGASAMIVVAVTFIINYVPAAALINIIGISFISFMIYLLYSITLSRLEYEEKAKEIDNKSL